MIDRAPAYGMTGVQVNGMDVIEVYNACTATLDAIRAGDGPQFLEIMTYRFEGHSMGDPLRYRTKDEVNKWREDDPIGILERHIFDQGAADRKELEAIDDAVDDVIKEAVEFAENSPTGARHFIQRYLRGGINMAYITMRQAITDALREENDFRWICFHHGTRNWCVGAALMRSHVGFTTNLALNACVTHQFLKWLSAVQQRGGNEWFAARRRIMTINFAFWL